MDGNQPSEPSAVTPSDAEHTASGGRVLIIDDDPITRQSLAAPLTAIGFAISEAENGCIGIERWRHEQPDLILCDLRMPEADGFEVLKVITREAPETPIIVISAASSVGDAVKALKLGAWEYLTKPIADYAVLEHAIHQALERARLLRKNREYQQYLEESNQRLQQSLSQLKEDEEAGRRLQFQLLPRDNQTEGNYHFSRRLWTSLYLSGDFVDYFVIDEEHLGFYMADVSGHGVSSAFVTVLLKSYMSRYLELYRQDKSGSILDPAKILNRLNYNVLKSGLNKYLTMFYGIIDKRNNRLHYSNGGQFPFPILIDGAGARFIECKSVPVGLFEFAEYRTETLDLPVVFTFMLISDGILEALPQSKLTEKQAFLLAHLRHDEVNIESLTQLLGLDAAHALPDDVTLLLIKKSQ